jgi:short-subunit dehydrogenase
MEINAQRLSGKVAIVTGASSGIGLATARLLARHGVKVALVARSKQKFGGISDELPGSLAVPADMTGFHRLKRWSSGPGNISARIDILINNAGQEYDAPVELIDLDIFRYIYDLSVVGPIAAMQQVIPIMRGHGGGTILNISSGTALMDLPGMSPYASAKKH